MNKSSSKDVSSNAIPLHETPDTEHIPATYTIHSGDATKSIDRIKELTNQ